MSSSYNNANYALREPLQNLKMSMPDIDAKLMLNKSLNKCYQNALTPPKTLSRKVSKGSKFNPRSRSSFYKSEDLQHQMLILKTQMNQLMNRNTQLSSQNAFMKRDMNAKERFIQDMMLCTQDLKKKIEILTYDQSSRVETSNFNEIRLKKQIADLK